MVVAKKIGISISKEEDCVLITVENTGEVLLAEELPHLFDSFYRGSNAGSQPRQPQSPSGMPAR